MSQDSPAPSSSRPSSLTIENPPDTIVGILRRLGPGLIVAGSIVGSGELIATTLVGAQAGFWLLWLIIIGCVIKVFVQVELGRYTIIHGKTTMFGMNEVPGPKVGRGNWLLWFWLLMFLASLGQLGGIVGGVGQALSISLPLTQQGREYNELLDNDTLLTVAQAELVVEKERGASAADTSKLESEIEKLQEVVCTARLAVADEQLKDFTGKEQAAWTQALQEANRRHSEFGNDRDKVFASSPDDGVLPDGFGKRSASDHKIWAAIIGVLTALILFVGRYNLIQSFATVMVFSFTALTVVNLVLLQSNPTWAVTWSDIWNGLSFRLPPASDAMSGGAGLATALAAFGIIGVGASELVTYPYWCLAKGYARFCGPRDDSPEWAERAKGWMRVMRWDAWCSMVVYTFATVAFYLLGAAILGRTGLDPKGTEMIRTLGVMYEPVFGPLAQGLFLFGAFAVLYSTYFVACASHARVFPDALRVVGVMPDNQMTYEKSIRYFSALFPLACLLVYLAIPAPVQLVLLSGLMQAIMLPMLAVAALYFRYRRCDQRLLPTMVWDIFLWGSAAGLLVTGTWALVTKLM